MRKVCPRCRIKKDWDDYFVRTRWPDGSVRNVQAWCKECVKAIKAERGRHYYLKRREDPERHAIQRESGRQHAERKRRARGVKPQQRGRTLERRSVDAAPIREAILKSRLAYEEIARAAGLDPSAVGKIASGTYTSTRLQTAVAITDALGKAPAEVGL